MRIMPFMKRKKGVQFAGTGLDIGSGGTTDYTDLSNKPQIAGVTLTGNKTLVDLGIQSVLTFDNTPTANSDNPVKSGGVASAINSNIPHKYDIYLDAVTAGTGITKTINEITQGEITNFNQLLGISIISAYGANEYDWGMKVIGGAENNSILFLPSVSQSSVHVILTLWFVIV